MELQQLVLMEVVESLQAIEQRTEEIQELVEQGKFEGIRGLIWTVKKACRDCVNALADSFWSMTKQPPQPPDAIPFMMEEDLGGDPAYEYEVGRLMAADEIDLYRLREEQLELRWR